MDSDNSANWTNGSRFAQDYYKAKIMDDYIGSFLLCVLGLPGNLLIIAVYIRKMTISTRVYLLALAVVDSTVCVCGIILTVSLTNFVTRQVFIYVFDMSTTFSVFLLVFVSIERLIAVKRPHSFNVKAQRAKTALVIIAVTACVFTTVTTVASLNQYTQFSRVFAMCTLFLCILTMTTCYVLAAAMLLQNTRTSQISIAVVSGTETAEPGCSHMFPKGALTTPVNGRVPHPNAGASSIIMKLNVIRPLEKNSHLVVPGPSHLRTTSRIQTGRASFHGAKASAPRTAANTTVATQTKNVTLLFIITVVFIACWLPRWIGNIGFSISVEVQRLFVLNSVINPFIYGVASTMFREDVRQFYRQTRVKLSACCQ